MLLFLRAAGVPGRVRTMLLHRLIITVWCNLFRTVRLLYNIQETMMGVLHSLILRFILSLQHFWHHRKFARTARLSFPIVPMQDCRHIHTNGRDRTVLKIRYRMSSEQADWYR